MAEVLVEFAEPIADAQGNRYTARACGAPMADDRWQGWIEFLPSSGGDAIRSARETTQPNRTDTLYWATGLTAVYLEGALSRALKPLRKAAAPPPADPVFDGPAEPRETAGRPVESVLNPFSVFRKGEPLLRRQLAALSAWHLVNIIRDYELSDAPADTLNGMPAPRLVDLIVGVVRERSAVSTAD
jgi:hypothetical protein